MFRKILRYNLQHLVAMSNEFLYIADDDVAELSNKSKESMTPFRKARYIWIHLKIDIYIPCRHIDLASLVVLKVTFMTNVRDEIQPTY